MSDTSPPRRSKEPWLWAALIAGVLLMQWPMLKGTYYRSTGGQPAAPAFQWRTDLDAALAEADRRGLPVLVDFSATWCPPCIAMQHDVWPDAEVGRLIEARVVPVMIDVDRDPRTAERFEVTGVPTILVLDADGRVLQQASYLPRSGMLRLLRELPAS
jgi:thiol-disulfide isomerase/thioredoxin